MSQIYENARAVMDEVKRAVTGKDDCIQKAFAAILAGGHILIEDVPGVGKTTLAIAFSKVMGLENHRVQFTPDVMPADILGSWMVSAVRFRSLLSLWQHRIQKEAPAHSFYRSPSWIVL